jgi:hypothetical protein
MGIPQEKKPAPLDKLTYEHLLELFKDFDFGPPTPASTGFNSLDVAKPLAPAA